MKVRMHEGKPLPPAVYFKPGAIYKVVRGVWHRIGPTLRGENVFLNSAKLPVYERGSMAPTLRPFRRSKQNAKGPAIGFSLTAACTPRMLNECGGLRGACRFVCIAVNYAGHQHMGRGGFAAPFRRAQAPGVRHRWTD